MATSSWILAARPKTLLASFAPVAMGSVLAWHDHQFHLPAACAALFGALTIQIGTNFCNDYCDFFQGADTERRKGPTRAVQSGLISPRAMLLATALMFSCTLAISLYLALRAEWVFLLIGAGSILFGILYTAGRYSLAYLGLGDPFVLVFFGPVAVLGTYYVQVREWNWHVALAGLAPGLLAVGLLVVNNLRDIDEDREANKRTLAVRFGATFSRWQYTVCVMAASFVPIAWWIVGGNAGAMLASTTAIPGAFVARRVWVRSGRELVSCLGMTAGLLLVYSVLFCLGVAVSPGGAHNW